MIKAVIFDIDGTLIDSVDYHAQAWQQAFRQYGHEIAFDDIREQIGKGSDKLMPAFLSEDEIASRGKAMEKMRGEIFRRDFLPKVKPFPHLHELFERIKADGKKIAVASSAKGDELETYKQMTGIGPYLSAQTSSDDAASSKPDPDIFIAALKGLADVDAAEVMVIGDTPYDAEAAAKAGMSTVGVLSGGFNGRTLLDAGCVALYADVAELLGKYDTSPVNT